MWDEVDREDCPNYHPDADKEKRMKEVENED